MYGPVMMIFNQLVLFEAVQITILMRAVQVRLKIVLDEFKLDQSPAQLFMIKDSLMLLHKTNELLNNCFKWPMLLNFLEFYFSLLANFYWLGMALLGLHSALIRGESLDMMNNRKYLYRTFKLFQSL